MGFYLLLNFNKFVVDYKLFTAIEIIFGIVISTLYIIVRNKIYYSSNIIYRKGKRPWRHTRPSYVMSYIGGLIISIYIFGVLNIIFNRGIVNNEFYYVNKIGSDQIRFKEIKFIVVENNNTRERKKFYIDNFDRYKIGQRVIVTTKKGYLGFDYMEVTPSNKESKWLWTDSL